MKQQVFVFGALMFTLYGFRNSDKNTAEEQLDTQNQLAYFQEENYEDYKIDIEQLYGSWKVDSVFFNLITEKKLSECAVSEITTILKNESGGEFVYLNKPDCGMKMSESFMLRTEYESYKKPIVYIDVFSINENGKKQILKNLEIRNLTEKHMIVLYVDKDENAWAYYYGKKL